MSFLSRVQGLSYYERGISLTNLKSALSLLIYNDYCLPFGIIGNAKNRSEKVGEFAVRPQNRLKCYSKSAGGRSQNLSRVGVRTEDSSASARWMIGMRRKGSGSRASQYCIFQTKALDEVVARIL